MSAMARYGWSLGLAGVAVLYGVSQSGVRKVGLGWDESIYFSQVSPTVPPAFFSAPRARGITWLAAPLAHFTSAVPDLRLYLTCLSSIALFLVYRSWFRVLPPVAVLVAAGAFASLWMTRFYGAELMPNLWVAFGAILGVGGFLRVATDRRDRAGLVCLPAGLAVAAAMRPTDAAWVTAALIVCVVVVDTWRRNPVLLGLTLAGPVLGVLPWVGEAQQRFGGVTARLRQASAIQGGLGWHPEVFGQHLRTIHGPLLCRPCNPPTSQPISSVWLLAVPIALLALLLVGAAHRRLPASVVVPAVAGVAIAVPYLLLVGYSAPRFFLPALGLLTLPVAVSLQWLMSASWWRSGDMGQGERSLVARTGRHIGLWLAIVALLWAGGAQVTGQQKVLGIEATASARSTTAYVEVAASLRRAGVAAPCIVSGTRSPQIAFYAGCASRNVAGHDASTTPAALIVAAKHQAVVAMVEPGRPVPRYVKRWARRDVHVPGRSGMWSLFTPLGGSMNWPIGPRSRS